MICVTGGRGFIGSHLVEALLERGDAVRVIDTGLSGNNIATGVDYCHADLTSLSEIEPLMEGATVVFHTAAIGRTPWCIEDPALCWKTNLLGSVNVMEAAKRAGAVRVVLSSSNVVYAPGTPYCESKLAMERAARVYTELYRLSTISLRYANTYGPRQREDGIGPNAFAALRSHHREHGYVEITGDGEQSRDWIHVSDVVRANLLAAKSAATGEIDICTGFNTSMNGIAELLGYPAKHIADRVGDVKHIHQDPEPAATLLGFRSEVALVDGVREVAEVAA